MPETPAPGGSGGPEKTPFRDEDLDQLLKDLGVSGAPQPPGATPQQAADSAPPGGAPPVATGAPVSPGEGQPRPVELKPLDAAAPTERLENRLELLMDVGLRVKVELGRTRMKVQDVLKLGRGSVVELDKLAGDPVDIFVNDRLAARGEVLILNDNFCIRITEILVPKEAAAR